MVEMRQVTEIVALHILEDSLRDIYVEGGYDERIYTNYLNAKKLPGNFLPITHINLDSIGDEFKMGLDLFSNRDKVIALSRQLNSLGKEIGIRCIIDRDFDDFLDHEV